MNMKRKTKRRVGIFLVVAMLAVMIYPAFSTTAEKRVQDLSLKTAS